MKHFSVGQNEINPVWNGFNLAWFSIISFRAKRQKIEYQSRVKPFKCEFHFDLQHMRGEMKLFYNNLSDFIIFFL